MSSRRVTVCRAPFELRDVTTNGISRDSVIHLFHAAEPTGAGTDKKKLAPRWPDILECRMKKGLRREATAIYTYLGMMLNNINNGIKPPGRSDSRGEIRECRIFTSWNLTSEKIGWHWRSDLLCTWEYFQTVAAVRVRADKAFGNWTRRTDRRKRKLIMHYQYSTLCNSMAYHISCRWFRYGWCAVSLPVCRLYE